MCHTNKYGVTLLDIMMIKKYNLIVFIGFTTIGAGSDLSKNVALLSVQPNKTTDVFDESSTVPTPRTSMLTRLKELETDLKRELKEKNIQDSQLLKSMSDDFSKNFYALFCCAKKHLATDLLELFMVYQLTKCQLNFDTHLAPPKKEPCADLILRSLYHLQLTENRSLTPAVRYHITELRVFLHPFKHPAPSRK